MAIHDPGDPSAVVVAEVPDREKRAVVGSPGGKGDCLGDGVLGGILEGAGKSLDLGHGLS